MNRLPSRLFKQKRIRTGIQAIVFLSAMLLPVGIFHMICPFGGIETLTRIIPQGLYVPKTGLVNLILLGVVLLSAVVAGPVFCGWLCPLGSIQDWIRSLAKKAKIKTIHLPQKLDFILSFTRYLLLFLIIRATYLSYNLVFMKVDPYYALMHFYTGEVAPVALFVLAMVIVSSFFIERPWCRYFCPLGAVLGPLGKISIFKVKKPSSSCIACGACSRACPVGLDPAKDETVQSSRCIRCGLCEIACPPKVKTSKHTFQVFFITALLLVTVFFSTAQITGTREMAKSGTNEQSSSLHFVIKPQTTLEDLAANTGRELNEIYALLDLPADYDSTTELVDIEDDYEEKTWNWIEDRL
jgi:polyferredoxin